MEGICSLDIDYDNILDMLREGKMHYFENSVF